MNNLEVTTRAERARPHWPSPHLHDNLALGAPLFEIRKRRLRLFERKYSVDHRPDAPRLEKLADLGELPTVGMDENERIRSATFAGVANDLAAQESEQQHHEEVHPSGASERSVRWPDE